MMAGMANKLVPYIPEDGSAHKIGKPAGNRGKGRPKGAVNKVTADVKAMILEALHGAGGAAYLQRQADESPAAFLSLVGKVLPLDVKASGSFTVTITGDDANL
jgi:hypothetical protein